MNEDKNIIVSISLDFCDLGSRIVHIRVTRLDGSYKRYTVPSGGNSMQCVNTFLATRLLEVYNMHLPVYPTMLFHRRGW